MTIKSITAILLTSTAVVGLPQAMAQQQSQPQQRSVLMEEITVTAQKREERLQDAPLSVTAFSGNAMRELGFTNSVDVAAMTPGLNIGTPVGEGNNPSITLRGIGLNDFNDNNEAPIAVYIDEIYMGSLAGQTFQLFDMDRVEVLRGPQGTLFGRNATGGLVHFITRKPSDELEVYGQVDIGEYSLMKVEGAVNAPLSDRVQARLSFALNNANGYVENRIGPNRNERDSLAWRLQVNFDVTDTASLLLKAHGAQSDVLAPVYQHQGTGLDANGGPCSVSQAMSGVCTDFFGYADTDGDNFAGAYDRAGEFSVDTIGASANFTWDMHDAVTLTSITGYEEVEKLHQEDTDMSPLNGVNPTFEMDAWQFSQELRLSGSAERLDWVAGGYYYEQGVEMPQVLAFGPDIDDTFMLDTYAEQDTRSWAVFGQLEYDITEQFSVVGGLRYTKDRKIYDYTQVDRLGGVTGLGIPDLVLLEFNRDTFGDLARFSEGVLSWKGGVNFRPNDDILLFTSVARGFKSGGFNAGFTEAGPEDIGYAEEQLTAYEGGIKTTLMGGLARFNATGFYYDYKDLQALTFRGVSSFITNAADATVYGAEFELTTSPLDGLDVNLGLSLLNTDADGLTGPDGEEVNDRKLVLAPKTSFNALVRYSQPVAGGMLAAQVDMNYQSSHSFDIFNQPLARSGGYDIWNARLGYRFGSEEQFEVAVWGKNIFKKDYLVYTFDFTELFGFNQQFYGPPQWFGVSFSFRN